MQLRNRIRSMSKRFVLNRTKVIYLLIASFAIFILISSIGGSQTGLFNAKEDAPTFQDDPETVDLPNSSEEGFNLSDFGEPPQGFNPPSDLAGEFGDKFQDGGFGNLPDPGDFEIPDPGSGGGPGGGGGGLPPIDPPPTGDPPITQPPTGGGGSPGNDKPGNNPQGPNDDVPDGDALELPDRPNKARNLWNLSSINLFPNSNFSINLGNITPTLPAVSLNNVVFAIIIFSMLYLPKSVIARLLEESQDKENEEAGQNSLFFRPDQEEMQKRKERERKQRLIYFSDYLKVIIEHIKARRNIDSPKEIMMWTYLELDEAFAKFSNLRRDRNITPLEHAKLTFEDYEIDNFSLEGIVTLFYLTRFGNRDMQQENIDELIDYIDGLVVENFEAQNKSSRWSLFG